MPCTIKIRRTLRRRVVNILHSYPDGGVPPLARSDGGTWGGVPPGQIWWGGYLSWGTPQWGTPCQGTPHWDTPHWGTPQLDLAWEPPPPQLDLARVPPPAGPGLGTPLPLGVDRLKTLPSLVLRTRSVMRDTKCTDYACWQCWLQVSDPCTTGIMDPPLEKETCLCNMFSCWHRDIIAETRMPIIRGSSCSKCPNYLVISKWFSDTNEEIW